MATRRIQTRGVSISAVPKPKVGGQTAKVDKRYANSNANAKSLVSHASKEAQDRYVAGTKAASGYTEARKVAVAADADMNARIKAAGLSVPKPSTKKKK
jgi:hypothetical protein